MIIPTPRVIVEHLCDNCHERKLLWVARDTEAQYLDQKLFECQWCGEEYRYNVGKGFVHMA